MKTSIKFIGTVIWVLMLTSCGQKTPTATSIPLTPTEEPKSTQSQPACCLETDQTLPKDGMGQIYVPAGEFQMGTDHGNNEPEKPLHKVYLDAFWIDRTLVTNAMFRKFVEDQNFQTDAEKKGWGHIAVSDNSVKGEGSNWQSPKGPGSNLIGLDEFPVSQVSWNDAKAYCEWAGRRLPTEAEWEKAARGTDGRTYPWGEGIDCEKANYWSGDAGCVGDLTAVGSYPAGASPYGALDMVGNVWEWVADWFGSDYYEVSPEQNPTGPDSGTYRVLRGGSWFMIDEFVQTYTRQNLKSALPDDSYFDYGFRCAVSENGQDPTTAPAATVDPVWMAQVSGAVPYLGQAALIEVKDSFYYNDFVDPNIYTYSTAIDSSHLFVLNNIKGGTYIVRFIFDEEVPQLTDLPTIGSPWQIQETIFESTLGTHSGSVVFSSPLEIQTGETVRIDIIVK